MEQLVAKLFGLPPNWTEAGPAVIFAVFISIAMILAISGCIALGILAQIVPRSRKEES